ncbi:hypothetical protein CFN78_23010 [Amycolatopsis antarctica]|uniref:DUF4253 domain-containing protein n=1 Tax=Amycolatopsis antarctica TaxID=1854586 RepID=A0A263D101_9PSEU|nr:DUF4253 domain-containing protein [Amycolatopsis antarctica]OZM71015.1 hypothetical protein CFN78_23010 [Amycolatopsis antarctica]
MTVVRDWPAQGLSECAPAGLSLAPGSRRGGMWVTDRALDRPDRYGHCVAEYERTGLWPVLVPYDERFAASGEDWIDDRARLRPALDRVDGLSAVRVLRDWWPGGCCEGACLRPYGPEFPGLATPVRSRTDRLANAGNTGVLLATRGKYRLGLVRVDRPADIPAAFGWAGAAGMTGDVAALSAVLRSWEERFSAVVTVLGFDVLEVAVAAPPRAGAHALALAAEHRAFCPDVHVGEHTGLQHLAQDLLQRRRWRFRWN